MHLLTTGSRRFTLSCAFLEDGPMVERARGLGYRTRIIPITHLTDPKNYLATIAALRRWIKQEKLAAVFSWMPKAHMYVAPAAALMPVKTIWYQHGISHGDKMDRITTRLPASRVFCCSAASRAAQDELPPKRWSAVCYPGVSFASSAPIPSASARVQLNLDPNARIVGMVARWERWKGVHIFVEAAKLAAAANPGSYFFVVGGPHPFDLAYAEELRTLAAASGLGDHLILAGQRPAEEVPLWQAAADLIVHPVIGEEPFGMAVVEAMGMGKVVIASEAGGLKEIIQHGENGFLVPPGDAAVLAETITRVLADEALRTSWGAAAFRRGRSFSVEAFAGRVDELLAETLAGPSA